MKRQFRKNTDLQLNQIGLCLAEDCLTWEDFRPGIVARAYSAYNEWLDGFVGNPAAGHFDVIGDLSVLSLETDP